MGNGVTWPGLTDASLADLVRLSPKARAELVALLHDAWGRGILRLSPIRVQRDCTAEWEEDKVKLLESLDGEG